MKLVGKMTMNFNRSVISTGMELTKLQNTRQSLHPLDSTVVIITGGDSEVLNWLHEGFLTGYEWCKGKRGR